MQSTTTRIRKIAEYFEVSADWLLGLADTPTTNPYQRAAFDALGLSYKAVRYLMVLNEIEKDEPLKNGTVTRLTLLSYLLIEPLFDIMLAECCAYIGKKMKNQMKNFTIRLSSLCVKTLLKSMDIPLLPVNKKHSTNSKVRLHLYCRLY